MKEEGILSTLAKSMPEVFARSEVSRLTGGTISAGTLANQGKKGPAYSIIAGKAVYRRDDFLAWLSTKTTRSGGSFSVSDDDQ
ncbi:MAG: hypothetical protein IKO41_11365 [Lachnospiraceae bacterium]|nr:hypothetical protein [Lachnospiraceae bacterium]